MLLRVSFWLKTNAINNNNNNVLRGAAWTEHSQFAVKRAFVKQLWSKTKRYHLTSSQNFRWGEISVTRDETRKEVVKFRYATKKIKCFIYYSPLPCRPCLPVYTTVLTFGLLYMDIHILPVFAAMPSRRKWPLDRYCRPKLCAILLDIVPFPDPGGPMIAARNNLAMTPWKLLWEHAHTHAH